MEKRKKSDNSPNNPKETQETTLRQNQKKILTKKDLTNLDDFIQKCLNMFKFVDPKEEFYIATGKEKDLIISHKSTIPDLVIWNKTFNKNECFEEANTKKPNPFPRYQFFLRIKSTKSEKDKKKEKKNEKKEKKSEKSHKNKKKDDISNNQIKSTEDYLRDYTLTDSEGNTVEVGEKRIYAPNFVYFESGKGIRLTTGKSPKQTDPREKLSDEMLKDEEKVFNEFFK